MNDFNAGPGMLRDMTHFIWEVERPRKVVETSVWVWAYCPLNEASRSYNGKEALLDVFSEISLTGPDYSDTLSEPHPGW
jgi:hypothetical protein